MTDALMPAVAAGATADLELFRTVGYWLALAESGASDEKSRGAAAALRLYYVRELGLTPLAAAEVSLIGGKLSLGAALLRAMAARRGLRVVRLDDDDQSCTAALVAAYSGEELGRATYSMADAQRAGLANKDNWKRNPARMLWARASKNVIVDYAPEIALGIILDDEETELQGIAEDSAYFQAIPDDLDADFGPPPGSPLEEEAEMPPRARSAAEVAPYVPPDPEAA